MRWPAPASSTARRPPPRLRTRLLRGLFLHRPVRLPLVQPLSAAATAAHLTDHVFPQPAGWTRSHHTCLRRAGPRCGMTATRRRMRGCTWSPIGIWRRNRHPTLRSISASMGERATHGDSDSLAGSGASAIPGAPLVLLVNSAFWRWIGQGRPDCGRGGGSTGGEGSSRGDTRPHAVEIPIRR